MKVLINVVPEKKAIQRLVDEQLESFLMFNTATDEFGFRLVRADCFDFSPTEEAHYDEGRLKKAFWTEQPPREELTKALATVLLPGCAGRRRLRYGASVFRLGKGRTECCGAKIYTRAESLLVQSDLFVCFDCRELVVEDGGPVYHHAQEPYGFTLPWVLAWAGKGVDFIFDEASFAKVPHALAYLKEQIKSYKSGLDEIGKLEAKIGGYHQNALALRLGWARSWFYGPPPSRVNFGITDVLERLYKERAPNRIF